MEETDGLRDGIEELYHEYPNDPVIAVYYADCLSVSGKDAADTATMFSGAIKSIKLFDEIIERHPDCLEARLLRVCQSCRLPEAFFRRAASAVKDIEYLIDAYENKLIEFDRGIYFKLLCLLGKAYGRIGLKGEAYEVWERVLVSDCGEEYKVLARELLAAGKGYETDTTGPETENLKPKELYKRAKQLHEQAKAGNINSARDAVRILERLHGENPEVAIIEGYYGSSLALAGKNSEDAQELFGSAIKGIRHLDSAVDKDPGNAKLRYLRANLCFNLPEAFFHLGTKTCEDFNYVLNAYEKNRNLLTEDEYCKVLYDLGICLRRLGKAVEADVVRERLATEYPGSKYSRIIKELEERSVDV